MLKGPGRFTNHFGDLVETIYNNFEENASEVVDEVHKELVANSPYYTGTLSSNWKKGIRPNSKGDNIRPEDAKIATYSPASTKKVKTYGIHQRYYIWNNTPYLKWVNAGINPLVPGGNDNNKGFIEISISTGVAKAQGKL